MPYTIPASSFVSSTSFPNEHDGLGLRRSRSGVDLRGQARMRRSLSDNHLLNRIRASSTETKLKNSKSFGIFPFQLSPSILPNAVKSLMFDQETGNDVDKEEDTGRVMEEVKSVDWMEIVLEIRSRWRNRKTMDDDEESSTSDLNCDEEGESGCEVCYGGEEEEEKKYDQESFSKLLVRVSWSDTKIYSKMAYLCNIAYKISQIKVGELRRNHGLRFVTSSLEKKAKFERALDASNTEAPKELKQKRTIRPYIAYEIAASAASYVKDMLSIGQNEEEARAEGEVATTRVFTSEAAACMAASTMTSVVSAGEEEKSKAANDLQSLHSSPCEWFICDDSSTYTRCFVIQGSDSLASWQANLFFEPIEFEGTGVLVHRGIYEAAKGIYEQFMTEIIDHLNRYGDRAKLQFTGHSLGGSLALLVDLMLLTRKIVNPSALHSVVTFGSPFVFCGGQRVLSELELDEDHVHCVMMHRDIVPRAFSCNYPDHVSSLLMRIKSFRSHPCLIKNKLLYSPMGKILILQPDAKSSPHHPLLPPGSGMYAMEGSAFGSLQSALKEFLNNPHPISTLSDPTAYRSDGTILRDHHSSNYVKAVQGLLRQQPETVMRNQMWHAHESTMLLPTKKVVSAV